MSDFVYDLDCVVVAVYLYLGVNALEVWLCLYDSDDLDWDLQIVITYGCRRR